MHVSHHCRRSARMPIGWAPRTVPGLQQVQIDTRLALKAPCPELCDQLEVAQRNLYSVLVPRGAVDGIHGHDPAEFRTSEKLCSDAGPKAHAHIWELKQRECPVSWCRLTPRRLQYGI